MAMQINPSFLPFLGSDITPERLILILYRSSRVIHPDPSKQSKQIVKILGALQTTRVRPTAIHAFAQAGIQGHQCLICAVNPTAAYCAREETTGTATKELSSAVTLRRHRFLIVLTLSLHKLPSSRIDRVREFQDYGDDELLRAQRKVRRQFFPVTTVWSPICQL
jgi:hypothetical protein